MFNELSASHFMYNKKWAFEGFKLKLLTLETLYKYKNNKRRRRSKKHKGSWLESFYWNQSKFLSNI